MGLFKSLTWIHRSSTCFYRRLFKQTNLSSCSRLFQQKYNTRVKTQVTNAAMVLWIVGLPSGSRQQLNCTYSSIHFFWGVACRKWLIWVHVPILWWYSRLDAGHTHFCALFYTKRSHNFCQKINFRQNVQEPLLIYNQMKTTLHSKYPAANKQIKNETIVAERQG